MPCFVMQSIHILSNQKSNNSLLFPFWDYRMSSVWVESRKKWPCFKISRPISLSPVIWWNKIWDCNWFVSFWITPVWSTIIWDSRFCTNSLQNNAEKNHPTSFLHQKLPQHYSGFAKILPTNGVVEPELVLISGPLKSVYGSIVAVVFFYWTSLTP